MVPAHRNVFLLASCQALLLTSAVTLISINALAGFLLAEHKFLATLPNATYVLGSAASTLPASLFMKRVGRRQGFLAGGTFGLAGSLLAVGSPGEASSATGINGNQSNKSAPGAGAAYVFCFAGGVWAQQAYVKAPNAETDDAFDRTVRGSITPRALDCAMSTYSHRRSQDGVMCSGNSPTWNRLMIR